MIAEGSYPLHDYGLGEKAYSFIDIENVRHGLERFLRQIHVDDSDFSLFDIRNIFESARCINRHYLYSAVAINDLPPQWISHLRASSRFIYRQTRLTEKGKKRKQEGVDVLLAIEAMQCAFKKTMNSCLIFSDDGDLLPLVDALVAEGITTCIVGFGNPEKSDVASRLRDASDAFFQIGREILRDAFRRDFENGKSNISTWGELIQGGGEVCEISTETESYSIIENQNGEIIGVNNVPDRERGHQWWGFKSQKHAEIWLRTGLNHRSK